MKEMIHGIHAATMRTDAYPFLDYRYRSGNMYFYDFSEVTYPGDLSHCAKCHTGTTYQNVVVPNALLTTVKVTTGNPAEDNTAILGARASMPNATDLVNSPQTSACYYCHATKAPASHFVQMGGDIEVTRTTALLEVPWDVTPAP